MKQPLNRPNQCPIRTFRIKPLRPIRNLPRPVQDQCRRKRIHPQQQIQSIRKQHAVLRLLFRQIRPYQRLILVAIHFKKNHFLLPPCEVPGHFLKVRLPLPARPAPRRPEIHHQHFPFGRCKRIRYSVRRPPQHKLRRLLQSHIARRFGSRRRSCILVIRPQQILPEPIFRSMRQPPRVSQFLPQFRARRSRSRSIRQRERQRILMNRPSRVFSQLRQFSQALRRRRPRRPTVTLLKILLRFLHLIQLLAQSPAYQKDRRGIPLLILFKLFIRTARRFFVRGFPPDQFNPPGAVIRPPPPPRRVAIPLQQLHRKQVGRKIPGIKRHRTLRVLRRHHKIPKLQARFHNCPVNLPPMRRLRILLKEIQQVVHQRSPIIARLLNRLLQILLLKRGRRCSGGPLAASALRAPRRPTHTPPPPPPPPSPPPIPTDP